MYMWLLFWAGLFLYLCVLIIFAHIIVELRGVWYFIACLGLFFVCLGLLMQLSV